MDAVGQQSKAVTLRKSGPKFEKKLKIPALYLVSGKIINHNCLFHLLLLQRLCCRETCAYLCLHGYVGLKVWSSPTHYQHFTILSSKKVTARSINVKKKRSEITVEGTLHFKTRGRKATPQLKMQSRVDSDCVTQ